MTKHSDSPSQGAESLPSATDAEVQEVPVFAIVGHPNKGKSSLVATLTQNDSVAISRLSGTTIQCQEFPMVVDGKTCYRIIDTPGFQRARPLLQQLMTKSAHAGDRLQALKTMVAEADFPQFYPDEYQLLQPILDGAAIIYLVDGAKPYRPEYESEMQILQWTGQPRLAVINPIGGNQYVEQWQQALDQFFSRVHVFNPLESPFQESMQLLKVFSKIRQQWETPVNLAVSALISDREHRIQLAVEQVCQSCINILCYREAIEYDATPGHPVAFARYQNRLRAFENDSMQKVEALLRYYKISRQEDPLQLHQTDLMDADNWFVWGLDRKELVLMALGGGAASGAVIDVGLGGASLFTGALVGGLAATGTALIYSNNKLRQRFKTWLPGVSSEFRQTSTIGPVTNPLFAWAVLGRAIYHLELLLQRTHAQRAELPLDARAGFDLKNKLKLLSKSETRILSNWLNAKGSAGKMRLQLSKVQKTILKLL